MTIAELQARVTAATEQHIESATAVVDGVLADVEKRWVALGAAAWSPMLALEAGALVTTSTYAAADRMTRLGVTDAPAEIALIDEAAASTASHVTAPRPDLDALRLLGRGLADRMHPGPDGASAEAWLVSNTWQAVRIVDTEAMRGYSAGRRAVMAALKAAGDSADYQVRKDWIPAILQRWNALSDKRRCAICKALDGQVRPLLASFGQPEPPTHPRCRCALQFWPIAVER